MRAIRVGALATFVALVAHGAFAYRPGPSSFTVPIAERTLNWGEPMWQYWGRYRASAAMRGSCEFSGLVETGTAGSIEWELQTSFDGHHRSARLADAWLFLKGPPDTEPEIVRSLTERLGPLNRHQWSDGGTTASLSHEKGRIVLFLRSGWPDQASRPEWWWRLRARVFPGAP